MSRTLAKPLISRRYTSKLFLARFLALICCASIAVVCVDAAKEARAQDCESMSGPARTDCFIGRSRIYGQQSGIAASAARVRTGEAYLRAVTGGGVAPKPHKVKPKPKLPLE
jgi:hypothetical protein